MIELTGENFKIAPWSSSIASKPKRHNTGILVFHVHDIINLRGINFEKIHGYWSDLNVAWWQICAISSHLLTLVQHTVVDIFEVDPHTIQNKMCCICFCRGRSERITTQSCLNPTSLLIT